MKNMSTLGERIEKRRKELNYTQTALAELAGISRRGLLKIIHDEANPRLKTLRSLARFLEVDIDWLVHGTDTIERAVEKLTYDLKEIKTEKGIIRERIEYKYNPDGVAEIAKKFARLNTKHRKAVFQSIEKYLKEEGKE